MTIPRLDRISGAMFCAVLAVSVSCGAVFAADPELAGKTIQADQNKDGKTDRWITYNSNGVRALVAADADGDGVPESWSHPIRGLMILREKDRNKDGRVDERMVTDFIHDNTLKFGRHLPLWRESDDNFDGVIDVYKVRGEKAPSPDRRGQKMDTTHWTEAKEAAIERERSAADAGNSKGAEQVRQMNARQDMKN